MKIVELRAENFKRLKAVRIAPDGALVVVRGRNAAGKSSVLDAIAAALGGKGACPDEPVRRGENGAEVVLTMDDLTVTRTWNPGGKTTLLVTAADGARYSSPQAMLDRLVGRLSFDPLAFLALPPDRQAAALREVSGLDTSAIDAERASAYAARTEVNTRVRQIEAEIVALPPEPPPGSEPPEAEVSIATLAEEYRAAVETCRKNSEIRNETARLDAATDAATERVEAIRRDLAAAEVAAKTARQRSDAATAHARSLSDTDPAPIAARMQDAEHLNASVRTESARRMATDRLDSALAAEAKEADRLTDEIDELDGEKRERTAAAKMPVEGLGFDASGGVTLNGLPLSQGSQAERIRLSVAMGIALNPTLRVILVRDGSVLDDDSLRIVAEAAEAADAQVWIERIEGEGGVLIEDGEVVGDATVVAAAEGHDAHEAAEAQLFVCRPSDGVSEETP